MMRRMPITDLRSPRLRPAAAVTGSVKKLSRKALAAGSAAQPTGPSPGLNGAAAPHFPTARTPLDPRLAPCGSGIKRPIVVLWLALMVAPVAAADGGAAGDGGPSDTRAVAESFDAMGNLPWYDAERGGVEPVAVRPRIDDSVNRASRWLAKPPKKQSTKSTSNSSTTTSGRSSNSSPNADVIGWVIVGVLMGLVVAVLVYSFLRIEDVPAAGETGVEEERPEELRARIEKLPIDVRQPVGDLLQEADRLFGAGKIAEAIIYLFGHRLLQLDRHHAIRLARGKTNRQYLNELHGRLELQYLVRETIDLFEKSYFGRYRVEREQFEMVRSRQPEFESLLAHLREAA